jgi:hypothetical protein
MKAIIANQRLNGFIVSNVMAMVIVGITKYAVPRAGQTVFIYSEFIITPMLMGIISAWFWRNLNLRGAVVTVYSCYNGFIAILLCFIFLGEGVICLLIVSPLIFCFVIAGAFIGRSIFKTNNTNLNISVVTLLLFAFLSDSVSKHNYENMVSDTITINAPADSVWKNVVSFKRIKQKNKYWLFRIGMPSPVESTVTGNYQGAGRKCIFSNGYIFGERIATYHPGKNLTFNVINQPRDPETMGHIDILKGQFLLKDNGDGTTTLTGNSWYKLYVFPVWYYDIWAQSITRNVHLRVMEHIKQLSEKNKSN